MGNFETRPIQAVGWKCPTGENSHERTWGNTFFAVLSLQSTTTALKEAHTHARGSHSITYLVEFCVVRA